MNVQIARKKLHINKKTDVNLILAIHTHLNIKATKYLGIYDKILWQYLVKPKLTKIHVCWSADDNIF